MHSQTLRTNIHRYTDTLTHALVWICVSTQNVQTYAQTYTSALTFIRVRAHTHRQHASSCALARKHAYVHELGHSRSRIISSVCVVSACVRLGVWMFVSVHVCLRVCVVCVVYVRSMCVLVCTSVSLSVFKNEKISTRAICECIIICVYVHLLKCVYLCEYLYVVFVWACDCIVF